MSAPTPAPASDPYAQARQRMMDLLRAHVRDARVLDAVAAVPRHAFVPEDLRDRAYADAPLPIGGGQTISQPLIVALMIEALRVRPDDHVLEVGSGSGYAAAVLSRLARDVVAVELRDDLREGSKKALAACGFDNVRVLPAGEELGRRQDGPYDAILVSAGSPHVPRPLVEQLTEQGRMIVPVGAPRKQELVRVTKTSHGLELARLGACAFVPLIGAGAWTA